MSCVASLTGVSPLRGRTTDETYLNITQATSVSVSSAAWRTVSDYAKDWLSKLLVKDSKKRMTVNDALAHPWLNVSSFNHVQTTLLAVDYCTALPIDPSTGSYPLVRRSVCLSVCLSVWFLTGKQKCVEKKQN